MKQHQDPTEPRLDQWASLFQLEITYVTKELAKRPTRPTAAPPTAVILQPRMSVKTLTMGEQKKIIPMESEPTQAEETQKQKLRLQEKTTGSIQGQETSSWMEPFADMQDLPQNVAV